MKPVESREVWMARLSILAVEADEQGYEELAAGLIILVNACRLPTAIKRRLLNAGRMLIEAAEFAYRLGKRKGVKV